MAAKNVYGGGKVFSGSFKRRAEGTPDSV